MPVQPLLPEPLNVIFGVEVGYGQLYVPVTPTPDAVRLLIDTEPCVCDCATNVPDALHRRRRRR